MAEDSNSEKIAGCGCLSAIVAVVAVYFFVETPWALIGWITSGGGLLVGLTMLFSNDANQRNGALSIVLIDVISTLILSFIYQRNVFWWICGSIGGLFIFFLAILLFSWLISSSGEKNKKETGISKFFRILFATILRVALAMGSFSLVAVMSEINMGNGLIYAFTTIACLLGFLCACKYRFTWKYIFFSFILWLCIPIVCASLDKNSEAAIVWSLICCLVCSFISPVAVCLTKGSNKAAVPKSKMSSKISISPDKRKKSDESPMDWVAASMQTDTDSIFADDVLHVSAFKNFVNSLRKIYSFPEADYSVIEGNLNQLINRSNDKNLYLGIMGDFSAGKSTFINAVLGFELLKTDTLQGTTCAPTILKYGSSVLIKVFFTDDRPVMVIKPKRSFFCKMMSVFLKPDCRKEIKEILPLFHEYTADENLAVSINRVEIFLPLNNSLLKSGVAVVDTPGLNSSTNQRHDLATRQALHDICDTALILSPASNAAPKDLLDFVKNNMLDIQKRCVLVLTKIDVVDSDEIEHILEVAAARFFSETKAKFAATVGVAARYVLDRKWQSIDDDKKVRIPEFRKDFSKNMEKVRSILSMNRNTILLEKTLHMLTDIIPLLSRLLEKEKHSLEERRKNLETNKLTKFDEFAADKKEEYVSELAMTTVPDSLVVAGIEKIKGMFCNKMFAKINSANDRDELKSVMTENVITKELKSLQNDILHIFKDPICKPLSEKTASCLQNFHSEFSAAYQRLQNIGEQEESEEVDLTIKQESMNVKSIGDFSGEVDAALAGDVFKTMGGAGAGALVGSFILPGLGTLIGAGIGAVIGFIFRKSLDNLKEEAQTQIYTIASNWEDTLTTNAYAYIKCYRTECQQLVDRQIEKYQKQYGPDIQRLVDAELAQQKALESKIQCAKVDTDALNKIKQKAENILIATNKTQTERNLE